MATTQLTKFYVTCGPKRFVVAAPSPRQAAVRLVDSVMSAHAWVYYDPGLSQTHRRDHVVLEALLRMDSEILVSERGHGRGESGKFEVPQLLDEWHQLMSAVARLFAE